MLLLTAATGIAAASECTDCHNTATPKIVEDFKNGAMADDVDCSNCHGSAHTSEDDTDEAKLPTPETCVPCHNIQKTQFMNGKHSIAWAALFAPPTTTDQPKELMEGQKGCGGCHKIGAKDETGWDEYEYDTASCDNCHTRHSFSAEEARKPEACLPCHQGFDHAQWEMYSTSKHGVIYRTEGDTRDWSLPLSEAGNNYTAPTCQLCHMADGDHAVITSWGFLGVRVEEPDQEWTNDRVSVLKAYGVLDAEGNPTPRFDLVGAAKLARLTMDEWNAPREEMIATCSDCHSEKFARNSLEEGDHLLRESDRIYANSIETVAA
ncbi:MAG TPA: cytochrome C, partial [Candidatus Methanoperedenaceae archaeon]|nr:cytochrome C [Candidatus Methanoperedenaceae archaeon]